MPCAPKQSLKRVVSDRESKLESRYVIRLTGNVSAGCPVFMRYILLRSFRAASGLPIVMRYLGLSGNTTTVVTRPMTGGIEQINRYIRQES